MTFHDAEEKRQPVSLATVVGAMSGSDLEALDDNSDVSVSIADTDGRDSEGMTVAFKVCSRRYHRRKREVCWWESGDETSQLCMRAGHRAGLLVEYCFPRLCGRCPSGAGSSLQQVPRRRGHQPSCAAPQDLSYTVWNSANKKQKIKLLTEVSGFLPPGHLSALMGPSGSSKTTLLGARLLQLDVTLSAADARGSNVDALFVRTAALRASQLGTLLGPSKDAAGTPDAEAGRAAQTYWRAARLSASSAARFCLLGSTPQGLSCGVTRAMWSSLVRIRCFMALHVILWTRRSLARGSPSGKGLRLVQLLKLRAGALKPATALAVRLHERSCCMAVGVCLCGAESLQERTGETADCPKVLLCVCACLCRHAAGQPHGVRDAGVHSRAEEPDERAL